MHTSKTTNIMNHVWCLGHLLCWHVLNGTASNTTVTEDTYVSAAFVSFWCRDWHSNGSTLDVNATLLPSCVLPSCGSPLHIFSSQLCSVIDSGDLNDSPRVLDTDWALLCAFLIAVENAWCLLETQQHWRWQHYYKIRHLWPDLWKQDIIAYFHIPVY